jgi:hypothetical protein
LGEFENLFICLLEARYYFPEESCLEAADDIRIAQLSLGIGGDIVITREVESEARAACLDCFGKIGKILDTLFRGNCQCRSLRVDIDYADNFNQRVVEKKIEHCCATAARTYNEYPLFTLGFYCHY